jgi:MSHA biogenesis protein MshP
MKHISHQAGLGLATALFVITVMALLAAMIFQLVRGNAETTGEEVLLIRSFYAAQSGVQFGLTKVFPPDTGGVSSCLAPYPQFELEADGLEACTADVSCAALPVVGSGTYYTITSTGTCGEVSRTVQVRAQ